MAKGIQDLGNGLGYVYITDPSSNILKVYSNNADTARIIKVEGVKASALGGNRVATAIVTIPVPTAVSTITSITIGAIQLIDTSAPINYAPATLPSTTAQDIVNAINSYVGVDADSHLVDFTAVRVGNDIYIFSDAYSGTTYNGQTPILVNGGGFAYTVVQEMEGGSNTTEIYDSAIGYRFYLDADYGATQCSGGGTASESSISNAVEITNFIVNIGFQSAMPNKDVTITSDTISLVRKGILTVVRLTGQGAANDNLENIIVSDVAVGDRILLSSAINTITVNQSGNIVLQSTTYDVITNDVIELIYTADNKWIEVSRSSGNVGSTADYRASSFGIFAKETFSTTSISTSTATVFVANVDAKIQELTGIATLSGNSSYSLDAVAIDGDEFWLFYNASLTLGAFTQTIFGVTLTANQALSGGLVFYARYVSSSWKVSVYPNLDSNITYPFKVYTDLIKANAITVSKLESTLQTEIISTTVSFAASEQGDMKIKLPFACTVNEFYASVSVAIAGTDNAIITPKNNASTVMTSGKITLTAASTIGTGFTSTPTANNTFAAGEIMTLTTAKTTAGGKAIVSIKITRL